ncbi:TMV resistance protein N-like isoform X2 [Fagus crenata]
MKEYCWSPLCVADLVKLRGAEARAKSKGGARAGQGKFAGERSEGLLRCVWFLSISSEEIWEKLQLRWLNYLKPNIKHGEFFNNEDRIIDPTYNMVNFMTMKIG